MHADRYFYRNLPALEKFEESTRPECLPSLPSNWHFFMTDVVDSTQAVQRGAYRAVNLAGAAGVTAAFNACERLEIPYVFCGDGAQLAVPSEYAPEVREGLLGVAELIRDVYELKLRVCGQRVGQLQEEGYDLRVGKVRMSEAVDQAVFWGTGLEAVDRLMRAGTVEPVEVPPPDLRGLECRWREVPTDQEEVINLLVQAAPGCVDPSRLYQEVLAKVESSYGAPEVRSPLKPDKLALQVKASEQAAEIGLRFARRSRARKRFMRFWSSLENRVGRFFMRYRLRFLGVDWGLYFDQVIGHSDHLKFTGMLALTAAGSQAARTELEVWLEKRWVEGDLAYGIHVSKASLITCVVLERNRRHFHFVDGADGGYAMAAKALKRRWNRWKESSRKGSDD
ncbi:MAG: DUF3095 domain-containing protein [Candidatus Methylacidiphilales bacterium]